MATHNPCFGSKIIKILYIFTPFFYYIKLGLKGDTFQGHVFLMFSMLQPCYSHGTFVLDMM